MPSLTLALLLVIQEPPPPAEPPPPPIVRMPPPVVFAPPPPTVPVYVPAPPAPPAGTIRPPVHVSGTIVNDDYPAAAIRANEEGSVTVRLTVTEAGRPESCDLIRSSGSAVLDHTTCSLLMRRARFSPARDDRGRPVRGAVTRTVRWQLPDDFIPPTFVSGRVVVPAPPAPGLACPGLASSRALAPIVPDLCSEAFPATAPADGDGGAAGRSRVAVLSLSASTDEPSRPRPPGRLLYREDASFEVAPAGAVLACRQSVISNSTGGSAFDLCRYLATEDGPFFDRDYAASATRPGRMTLEIYETAARVDPASLIRP
jgi:protein TonB